MSKSLAKVVSMDEALMARQLGEQYQRAVGGIWEVVKFGAMLAHLRDSLIDAAKQKHDGSGRYADGEGLKAWLDVNCPDISRRNAYRFMAIAEGLREELHVPERVDLVALLTADHTTLEPKLLKHRSKIADFLEGKSQRQLLLMLGDSSQATRNAGGAQQLNAFLREAHPDLVDTPYKKLPEPVQKEWADYLAKREKERLNGMTPEEFRARHFWDEVCARLHEERSTRKLYLALPLPYLKRIDAMLMDLRADMQAVLKKG